MSDKDQLIELLTKVNKEQEQTIKELRAMIANLQETLNELQRKLFGTSSEKTGKDPSEKETDCKEVQPLKALRPIFLKLSGKETELREEQL